MITPASSRSSATISSSRSTGLPLLSAPGRRGGHALHPRAVLPPLNLIATETIALLLALPVAVDMPYGSAARSAANKLRALLPPPTAVASEQQLARFRVQTAVAAVPPRVLSVVEESVTDGTSVSLRYTDRHGATTDRTVEPAGFYGTPDGWHLAAWCRLSDDARLFRLDRIIAAEPTRQPVEQRDLDAVLGWLPAPAAVPEP